MCKILVSRNDFKDDLELIVYNLVFSESSGRVTTESICLKLEQNKLNIERKRIELLLNKWLDTGILFDNSKEYIVNSV